MSYNDLENRGYYTSITSNVSYNESNYNNYIISDTIYLEPGTYLVLASLITDVSSGDSINAIITANGSEKSFDVILRSEAKAPNDNGGGVCCFSILNIYSETVNVYVSSYIYHYGIGTHYYNLAAIRIN